METDRIKKIINQIIYKGEADKFDLIQLQDAGVPIFRFIEEHTGKPARELLKALIMPQVVIDSINESGIFALDKEFLISIKPYKESRAYLDKLAISKF